MNYSNANRILSFITSFLLLSLYVFTVSEALADSVKEDNVHVRNWNNFATDLHEFHKKQTANKKIIVKSKKGGYATDKEFYLEKEHYDEQGKLLSRVSWELDNPENIHVIEVFVHDKNGNVIRDYSAAFLPVYRNAPNQTLISFHQYNNGLHAFRSFDATGDRILERCEGKYDGREVSFMLDEDELYEFMGDEKGIMYSEDYKLCFNNLKEELGIYIKPQ